MAVTFSASGITYSNGQVQKYAGIGSDTKLNKSAQLWTPKWGPVINFVPSTFYYPTSATQDVAIISVIFSHGPINNPDLPYATQIVIDWGTGNAGATQAAFYNFDTYGIGNPIITMTIVLPPNQYGFRAGASQSGFVVGALQWASQTDYLEG